MHDESIKAHRKDLTCRQFRGIVTLTHGRLCILQESQLTPLLDHPGSAESFVRLTGLDEPCYLDLLRLTIVACEVKKWRLDSCSVLPF